MDGICSSYILPKGFQMMGAQVDVALQNELVNFLGMWVIVLFPVSAAALLR